MPKVPVNPFLIVKKAQEKQEEKGWKEKKMNPKTKKGKINPLINCFHSFTPGPDPPPDDVEEDDDDRDASRSIARDGLHLSVGKDHTSYTTRKVWRRG